MSPQGTAPTLVPAEDDIPILWAFQQSTMLLDDPDATLMQDITVTIALWAADGSGGAMNLTTGNAFLCCAFFRGVTFA